MSRKLPPLNALKAFESAARHLSFTKAADELNVTPAAISHQVKALEETLDTQLFYRKTRALHLTDAGQLALPLLSDGFDKLVEGVQKIRGETDHDVLTISVSPSFGAMWLVPRLEKFRRLHPDIEIRIDASDRLVDVTSGEADVAIRYGPGGYTGVHVAHLFDQLNTPVCSPALLAGKPPLKSPEDLRNHTLLHIDWKDAEASWGMWLLAAGLDDIDPNKGPQFSMESMAVQAALDGQGVALVGEVLVADDLAAGRLVRPFDPDLSTPLSFAFYLIRRNEKTRQLKVEAFSAWLVEVARGS